MFYSLLVKAVLPPACPVPAPTSVVASVVAQPWAPFKVPRMRAEVGPQPFDMSSEALAKEEAPQRSGLGA